MKKGERLDKHNRAFMINRDNLQGTNTARTVDYTNRVIQELAIDEWSNTIVDEITISSDEINNQRFVHAVGDTPVSHGVYATENSDFTVTSDSQNHSLQTVLDDESIQMLSENHNFRVQQNGKSIQVSNDSSKFTVTQSPSSININNGTDDFTVSQDGTSISVTNDGNTVQVGVNAKGFNISTPTNASSTNIVTDTVQGTLGLTLDANRVSRSVSRDVTQQTRTETDDFIQGITETTIVDYANKAVTYQSSDGSSFTIVDGSGGSNPPPSVDLTQAVTNSQFPTVTTLTNSIDSLNVTSGTTANVITCDHTAGTITFNGVTVNFTSAPPDRDVTVSWGDVEIAESDSYSRTINSNYIRMTFCVIIPTSGISETGEIVGTGSLSIRGVTVTVTATNITFANTTTDSRRDVSYSIVNYKAT